MSVQLNQAASRLLRGSVPDKHGALLCWSSCSLPAELFSFPLRSASRLINGAPGSPGWEPIHPGFIDSGRQPPVAPPLTHRVD